MDTEYISNAEIEKFEAEYQEYLKTRTPEQEKADRESLERVKARVMRMLAYRRLLDDIFKK